MCIRWFHAIAPLLYFFYYRREFFKVTCLESRAIRDRVFRRDIFA